MDVLANDPSPDDIVQLALLQPNASEVFVQASARVKGDHKKSWFKWRWEGLIFSCTLYNHHSHATCACTCYDIHMYMYMYLHSNKESDPEKYVLKLKVHRAGVKMCQYSRDGGKVISCSNDFGVKVQSAHTHIHVHVHVHV